MSASASLTAQKIWNPQAFAVLLAAAVGGLLGCVEPTEGVQLALDKCAVSPEGALCDDGQPCTVNDQCIANICVGIVALDGTLCTDGDVCTLNDLCDKGRCIGLPAPDNSPCTDGDPCTTTDVCRAAKCVPGPLRACDDGNMCTIDTCMTGVGCQFMSVGDCSSPPETPDAALDMSIDSVTDVPGDPVEAVESLMEVSPDVPEDAPADVVDVAEAAEDAPAEAPEAPRDAPPEPRPDAAVDTTTPLIDLRARGGACDCEFGASSPAEGAGFVVAGLLLVAGGRRRRRRGNPV